MSVFDSAALSRFVQTVGWVLLHFVWQGALVAVVMAAVLHHLRRASAHARYLVSCAGMMAMLLLPLGTFALLSAAGPGLPLAGVAASGSAAREPARLWSDPSGSLPWLVLAWSLGAFVLLARAALQWLRAWRLVRRDTSAVPPGWEQVVRELGARMGIRRAVRLRQTARAMSPVIVGCVRPVILVPVCAFTGLTPEQLRAVLAHELAHVRRYDYWVNLVQTGIECLLFYHPCVWWLSGRLRAEREFCCDDTAVRVSGSTLCYVRALSALDEMRDADLSLAMASNGGSLMTRISRLVGARSNRPRRTLGWLAPAMLAMTLTASASALALRLPADVRQERAMQHGDQDQQRKPKAAPAGADQERAAKKRAEKRASAEKKANAKKSKLKALIRDLRAKGLSDVEIERFLARRAKSRDERRWQEEQAAWIAEMQAEGMSQEAIKRALQERRRQAHHAELQRRRDEERRHERLEQARVAKLRAAGLSDDEIKVALERMIVEEHAAEKRRRDQARAREFDAQREARIREMREAGMSPDQIRAALAKSAERRKQATRRDREVEHFHRALKQRIAGLQAHGASKAEIERHIAEWKRDYHEKLAADKSHADRLRARRFEMIREMQAQGMPEKAIQHRLQEWHAKLGLQQRDLETQRKLLEAKKAELRRKKAQLQELRAHKRQLDK